MRRDVSKMAMEPVLNYLEQHRDELISWKQIMNDTGLTVHQTRSAVRRLIKKPEIEVDRTFIPLRIKLNKIHTRIHTKIQRI